MTRPSMSPVLKPPQQISPRATTTSHRVLWPCRDAAIVLVLLAAVAQVGAAAGRRRREVLRRRASRLRVQAVRLLTPAPRAPGHLRLVLLLLLGRLPCLLPRLRLLRHGIHPWRAGRLVVMRRGSRLPRLRATHRSLRGQKGQLRRLDGYKQGRWMHPLLNRQRGSVSGGRLLVGWLLFSRGT